MLLHNCISGIFLMKCSSSTRNNLEFSFKAMNFQLYWIWSKLDGYTSCYTCQFWSVVYIYLFMLLTKCSKPQFPAAQAKGSLHPWLPTACLFVTLILWCIFLSDKWDPMLAKPSERFLCCLFEELKHFPGLQNMKWH